MTRIPELLAAGPTLSFEFSAPRDAEGVTRLERTLGRLAELKPAFMSVTYGAGGATRGPTREWVSRIREVHGVEAMPHLTCVSHTRAEVAAIVDSYAADGIENLLALRGDLPSGGGEPPSSELPSGAFGYARELAEFVRERAAMSIGVAAHPEGHPLAVSAEADRAHQAAKIGAADFAITQFFFDAAHYWRFVEEMRGAGRRAADHSGADAADECGGDRADVGAQRDRVSRGDSGASDGGGGGSGGAPGDRGGGGGGVGS